MTRAPTVRARDAVKAFSVFSAAQCREADRVASGAYALPTLLLMEHAGQAVSDECRRVLARLAARAKVPRRGSADIVVVCGPGNNGGDGLVVARRLVDQCEGSRVRLVLSAPPDRFRGDAAKNMTIAQRLKIPFHVWPACGKVTKGVPLLLVDALLGTGTRPPLREPIASMVSWIEATRAAHRHSRVVSIDVPSGVDADSGESLGPCVRADVTVSLMGLKPGLLRGLGRRLAGRVVVGDIGMPRAILAGLGPHPVTRHTTIRAAALRGSGLSGARPEA